MQNLKISILTATYNREQLLKNIYNSIIKNLKEDFFVEWLIMDDGSTDSSKDEISKMQNDNTFNNLDIKYFYQENQGKMTAINKLVLKATGDLIVDCDSDDYFTKNAFEIINKCYKDNLSNLEGIYGFCFLKNDQNGNNMGKNFLNEKSTMFDLYFKEGEDGEKAIVFLANIRKKFKHKLEQGEKFVTEARMYHEMDQNYKMICINEPIMICEYQEKGYSKNIKKQFKDNPYGYYEYFKEILNYNTKGVLLNKRIYAIKHYILFKYLTRNKKKAEIQGIYNKVLYYVFYFFGITKIKLEHW